MRKIVFLIFLLFFSISCITSNAYRYPGFIFSPTNPKQIQVLYLAPSIPFEIIGEVTARGPAISTWREVENVMRKAVAKIGGQAVIIVERREPYVASYISPSSGKFFVYEDYIYYTYNPGMRFQARAKNLLGLVIRWNKK